MSSGVSVDSSCVEKYQELKLKKIHKFIIFKLSKDLKEIIVDQTSESPDYEEFVQSLPEDEPRWAVYDFKYEVDEGGARNKLVFVSWFPDGARVRAKMVYASSREALRRKLDGIAAEIQATDYSEVAYETVLHKVNQRAWNA
jgi:cofilin